MQPAEVYVITEGSLPSWYHRFAEARSEYYGLTLRYDYHVVELRQPVASGRFAVVGGPTRVRDDELAEPYLYDIEWVCETPEKAKSRLDQWMVSVEHEVMLWANEDQMALDLQIAGKVEHELGRWEAFLDEELADFLVDAERAFRDGQLSDSRKLLSQAEDLARYSGYESVHERAERRDTPLGEPSLSADALAQIDHAAQAAIAKNLRDAGYSPTPATPSQKAGTPMSITVYSKPSCVQCTATYRALDAKGLKYDVVDISEDPAALEHVKSLGYMQAPVVTVGDEHWSGFRPDKIKDIDPALATQPAVPAPSIMDPAPASFEGALNHEGAEAFMDPIAVQFDRTSVDVQAAQQVGYRAPAFA